MSDASIDLFGMLPFDRGRLSQRHSTWTVAAAGTVTLGVLVGSWFADHHAALRPAPDVGIAQLTDAFRIPPDRRGPALPEGPSAAMDAGAARLGAAFRAPPAALPSIPVAPGAVADASRADGALLDPAFAIGPAPADLAAGAPPLAWRFPAADTPPPAPSAASAPLPVIASAPQAEIAMLAPLPEAPHDVAPVPPRGSATAAAPIASAAPVESVPLPAPRPSLPPAADPEPAARAARRQMARNTDRAPAPAHPAAPAAAAPSDNRGFLEKFFGMLKPSGGPALAYAAPEDGLFGRGRAVPASPAVPHDQLTAVYDISAHTVFMPDGSRLEAHSGLGRLIDDPHFVHVRNSGPTPPAVYDLQPREALFHGVQALRLSPVGSGVFGRTGLLAHTFMLGPNGDSNGCVSFRDYASFLRAYQNGAVRRLVVVPGVG